MNAEKEKAILEINELLAIKLPMCDVEVLVGRQGGATFFIQHNPSTLLVHKLEDGDFETSYDPDDVRGAVNLINGEGYWL